MLQTKYNLKKFQNNCIREVIDRKNLKQFTPRICQETSIDYIVAASFGFLIQPHILSYCKKTGINIHPSLLPKYRGSSPLRRQIYDGVTDSGITLINLHPTDFDRGEILMQVTKYC